MGFLDKFLYNNTEEIKNKVETPITPLITNTNQNVVFNDNNPFAPKQNQTSISPEDKEKWQKYFGNLFTKVKSENIEYGQFLNNIDTVIETDPTITDSNKFKFAFSFMKKAGIDKGKLLSSMDLSIKSIENDRKIIFDVDIQKRNDSILTNTNSISDKKASIQKLVDEIKQLELDIENTKEKITTKTLCYNTLSAQLMDKMKNDITGVTNYIQ